MPAGPRDKRSEKPARKRRVPATGESTVRPLHEQRPRRREREVLDVAARLFHERGYADTSVQDIADELGILKGSLYHYIEVKEDLLFRLLEQLHDDTQALLEQVAAREDLSPLERLSLYVRTQVQFDLEHLARVAVYYNDYERLSPARRAEILGRRRIFERWVSDMIEQAQAGGEADPALDARLLGNFLHGALLWTYRWYRPRGRVSREKIAETCAAFVLRGVVGEETSTGRKLPGDPPDALREPSAELPDIASSAS
jgi:TetR/AcrR family transcriptional regulator, cholesterol catabolism regulator